MFNQYTQHVNRYCTELTKLQLDAEKSAFFNALWYYSVPLCYPEIKNIPEKKDRPWAPNYDEIIEKVIETQYDMKEECEQTQYVMLHPTDEVLKRLVKKKVYDENGKQKDDERGNPMWEDMSREEMPSIDNRIAKHLFKKVIIMKLQKIGIFCRQFYCESMSQIWVVMKMTDERVNLRAAEQGLNKQRELGISDYTSLEPVDEQQRLIRLRSKKFMELQKERMKKAEEASVDIDFENEDRDVGVIVPASNDKNVLYKVLHRIRQYSHEDFAYSCDLQAKNMKCVISAMLKAVNQAPVSYGKIEGEKDIRRKELESAYLFYSLVQFWMPIFEKNMNDESFKPYLPLILRMIMLKSYDDANKAYGLFNRVIFFLF